MKALNCERGAVELKTPRPTVGAFVFNPRGKFLLVKSSGKWGGKWLIPGGGIDFGETSEDALRREFREETGLELHSIELLEVEEVINPSDFHEEEHFIFFDFYAKTDSEDVKLNDEANEFKWVLIDEALEMDLNASTRKALERFKVRKHG
ncbi:MAG: NUDIX domain-containing protein [Candidatus Micrarchaeota archaeon]